MIRNSSKLLAIIVDKIGQTNNPTEVIFDGKHVKSDDSVYSTKHRNS